MGEAGGEAAHMPEAAVVAVAAGVSGVGVAVWLRAGMADYGRFVVPWVLLGESCEGFWDGEHDVVAGGSVAAFVSVDGH